MWYELKQEELREDKGKKYQYFPPAYYFIASSW